jgi:ABC-type Mn2+/Zn2+ transport system ATPase subunit
LLKAISGMITPSSGRLMTNGKAPRLGRSDVALLVQRTSLTPGFPCTVERLALMGRLSRRLWTPRYSQEDITLARAALDAVGLNSLRHRLLHELSGGQLQRALLARALCQGATLLLLDEPYAGIDQASRQALNEILFGPALNGVTLLLSTHDSVDSSLCDRIFTADAGKISLRVACDGQHPHRHVALDS